MTRMPLWSWIVAMGLLVPLTAAAEEVKPFPECTREPTSSDIDAAKAAFQAGNASFNEADYPRAILYWEDAYRRDCTAHALLLNLARAYELNGQREQAVLALETYLTRRPEATDRDSILRRIEVLRETIANEPDPAQPEPEPAAPIIPPPTVIPPVLPPASTELPVRRSWVPLVVAGAGAAVAIVGGVLWADATADVSSIEDRCDGDRQNCRLAEEGNDALDRQTGWGIASVVGLGAAAGGVAWYFLQPTTVRAAPTSGTRVMPAVGPGFAGIRLGGAF